MYSEISSSVISIKHFPNPRFGYSLKKTVMTCINQVNMQRQLYGLLSILLALCSYKPHCGLDSHIYLETF